MKRNLIVRRMHSGQRWVEERTGILFGTFHWRGGPLFHLTLGRSNRTDTVFEVSVLRRVFWIAPTP